MKDKRAAATKAGRVRVRENTVISDKKGKKREENPRKSHKNTKLSGKEMKMEDLLVLRMVPGVI